MKNTVVSVAVLGLMAWWNIALAESGAAATPTEVKAAAIVGVVGSGTATVAAVDHGKREVTLEDSDGQQFTLPVGPEARNFDQVEVGDNVEVSYSGRILVSIKPEAGPGAARGIIKTVESSRSPEGARPYGSVTRNVEIFARVEAVDPTARTVTLRGAHGELALAAAEGLDLSNVEVGKQVKANFRETVTIAVTAPPSERPRRVSDFGQPSRQ